MIKENNILTPKMLKKPKVGSNKATEYKAPIKAPDVIRRMEYGSRRQRATAHRINQSITRFTAKTIST